MKTVQTLLATLLMSLGPLQMPAHAQAAGAAAASSTEMSEGEIRKVDPAQKRITLKHGEIKNLNMGGMTMVFEVKNAALLERLKAGDKVRFRAIDEGGKLYVTAIELRK